MPTSTGETVTLNGELQASHLNALLGSLGLALGVTLRERLLVRHNVLEAVELVLRNGRRSAAGLENTVETSVCGLVLTQCDSWCAVSGASQLGARGRRSMSLALAL